jgi:hypothetical protein
MSTPPNTVEPPADKTFKQVYFPTIESCWDYGIARNAPLLPFIGSLLPYNFLRGVQFDTKVFKLWEFIAASKYILNGVFNGLNARNEIKLVMNNPARLKLLENMFNTVFARPDIKVTADGSTTVNMIPPDFNKELAKEAINAVYGDTINIAVDNDSSLEFQVTNKWGGGEDIITQVLQGAATIIQNISEGVRTANLVTDNSDGFATVPFSPKRYQGSDFGDLTINFTLFTRNNFIRDIYIPLLYLKTICVPKKLEGKDASTLLAERAERVINTITDSTDEQKQKAN